MRTVYYRDAIREAIDEEMARDPSVLVLGEDMGPNGGTWKETRGLWEKYGDLRMKDTPISESGFVGMSVGMALTGLRPVAKVMFSDFMLVAMDQIANQMAKITYMSGGQKPVPMVLQIRSVSSGLQLISHRRWVMPLVMAENFSGMTRL